MLIGENGAGKSTMMKMLAGVETPSSGQIILDGEAVSLQSTHQAEKLGISIIFQELNLFPNMNVMDNIFMANEFFQKGRINEKYQYALAKSLLERLELDVDPYAPLGELGIGHLRAAKNRYGSTNELGMFDMTGQGLEEIENPKASSNVPVKSIETRPVACMVSKIGKFLLTAIFFNISGSGSSSPPGR